ncbi:unnamed protein product, partial [Scytosiphon promiscuus]
AHGHGGYPSCIPGRQRQWQSPPGGEGVRAAPRGRWNEERRRDGPRRRHVVRVSRRLAHGDGSVPPPLGGGRRRGRRERSGADPDGCFLVAVQHVAQPACVRARHADAVSAQLLTATVLVEVEEVVATRSCL